MRKLLKTMTVFLLAAVVTLNGTFVTKAKTKQYNNAIVAYKKLLTQLQYDPHDKVFKFMTKDLNDDGTPELLVDILDPENQLDKDNIALRIYSFDGKNPILIYDTMIQHHASYNEKTNTITIESEWNGRYDCSIYKVTKKISPEKGLRLVYDYTKEKGKYIVYSDEKQKFVKVSKKIIDENTLKYRKNNKPIEFSYQNTKANRAKYLN